MGQVKILKTVNLDFLGEDYKDAYVRFHALPVGEYQSYIQKINEVEEEGSSIEILLNLVQKQFKDGKFPDENGELFDLKKENIREFDIDTVTKVFRMLTGQDEDPK